MDTPFGDLLQIQEAARAIRLRADVIRDVAAQARSALEHTVYECDAARRQRAEMTVIASRTHVHGEALAQLADDVLRRVAAAVSGQP
jgi:hypothetical protein